MDEPITYALSAQRHYDRDSIAFFLRRYRLDGRDFRKSERELWISDHWQPFGAHDEWPAPSFRLDMNGIAGIGGPVELLTDLIRAGIKPTLDEGASAAVERHLAHITRLLDQALPLAMRRP